MDAHDLVKISGTNDEPNLSELLDNILVPRVVGTSGHTDVRNYIVNTMSGLGWAVETDKFDAKTPIFGVLPFENIIATINPHAERFLILACHYDSKYFKNMVFLGATDSAVPCAMLINLATVLAGFLKSTKNNNDLSLQLVFFDGEEALETWSDTDSIYGAKHLAAKWESEGHLPKIVII